MLIDVPPVQESAAPAPGWLLDEVASAGRENLDAEHVARYDAKEDAAAAAEVLFCRELGLNDQSVVVELGVGTGQFALAVAPACARVVAVDVSPVMLRALRSKIERSKNDQAQFDNIEVVQAGFLTYEHEGSPADIVYSRYALHHLPDFWKAVALSRIYDMIRPGGLFRLWDVVFSFEPGEAADRIEAWCATGGVEVEADWSRAELEEHVRDEHSTFTWLLEPMIQRSGFAIEAAEYSADGIFAQYVLRRP
jgi:ubiquinone/menaquinone biosynthesis C-methylase UbiE